MSRPVYDYEGVLVPEWTDACEAAWKADPHGWPARADPERRYDAVEAYAAGWNAALDQTLTAEGLLAALAFTKIIRIAGTIADLRRVGNDFMEAVGRLLEP